MCHTDGGRHNADRFPEWTPVSDEQRLPNRWKEFVEDRQVSRRTQKKYQAILDGLVERTGTDDMSAVRELACILCLPT
jgi:hypothetical protein